MIEWQDSYSTGVNALDEQHKYLFVFFNDLERAIQEQDVSGGKLDWAISFLGRYIQYHFDQEENCMYRYKCPIAGKNKTAHKKFIQVYAKLEKQASTDDNPNRVLCQLHEFLQSWIVDHICRIDSRLKPCAHP